MVGAECCSVWTLWKFEICLDGSASVLADFDEWCDNFSSCTNGGGTNSVLPGFAYVGVRFVDGDWLRRDSACRSCGSL